MSERQPLTLSALWHFADGREVEIEGRWRVRGGQEWKGERLELEAMQGFKRLIERVQQDPAILERLKARKT